MSRGDVQKRDQILNELIRNEKLPKELRDKYPNLTKQVDPADFQEYNPDMNKLFAGVFSPAEAEIEPLRQKYADRRPSPYSEEYKSRDKFLDYLRGQTGVVGGKLIENYHTDVKGMDRKDIPKHLYEERGLNVRNQYRPTKPRTIRMPQGEEVRAQSVSGYYQSAPEELYIEGPKNDPETLYAWLHELGHAEQAREGERDSRQESIYPKNYFSEDNRKWEDIEDVLREKRYYDYADAMSRGHHPGYVNYPIETILDRSKESFRKQGLQPLDDPKFQQEQYLIDEGLVGGKKTEPTTWGKLKKLFSK